MGAQYMNSQNDLWVSILGSVSGIKSEIIQFMPNLISALIILVVGVFIAYILRWSSSLFTKGFFRLLPNSLHKNEFLNNNLKSFALGVGQFLFLITIFITVAVSLNKMGLQIVSNWMENIGKYLPNIIGAVLILFVGWKTKETVGHLTQSALSRTDILHSTMISKTLSWSIFIISVLVSLEQVGIDMSLVVSIATVVVGVASAGVALTFALAAKATISDILYCYQLHKFFKPGQVIELKGVRGTIKSIGPVFVLVETDKGSVTLPGNIFSQEVATLVKNESTFNG